MMIPKITNSLKGMKLKIELMMLINRWIFHRRLCKWKELRLHTIQRKTLARDRPILTSTNKTLMKPYRELRRVYIYHGMMMLFLSHVKLLMRSRLYTVPLQMIKKSQLLLKQSLDFITQG
jgi:hypothetical protein